MKAPKRLYNWVKKSLRSLITTTAAFTVVFSANYAITEAVHPTSITIHGDAATRSSITNAVDHFPSL